jgi:hypothetical protein
VKANRHGRLVYTIKGFGARLPEPQPVAVETPPPVDVTGTEISVLIPRAAPIPKPERVCPHGGIHLGKIIVCAECGRADADELFGLAILYMAHRAARRVFVATNEMDDCVMTAVMALNTPKSRTEILRAKEPDAMAMTIAKRAIIKMYRRGRSVQSMPVGWMNFPLQSDKEEASTNTRLGVLGDAISASEAKQKWQEACYERVRTFPGIGLLWNEKNLNRIQIVLDEAKRGLQTTPFSVWKIISMRLGLGEGMKEHDWREIAEQVSSWKTVNERQVRYAYQQGLQYMKSHLINSLMPSGKVTDAE